MSATPIFENILAVSTAMGSIATAVGIGYMSIQIKDARRTTSATLVHELEDHFRINYSVYTKLLPNGQWCPEGVGPTTPEEDSELESYLEFFEKINVMLTQRVLSMQSIDLMYAHRFFLAMNNPHAQRLIIRDFPYWVALLDLYRDWTGYRAKRKLPIVNPAFAKPEWTVRSSPASSRS